MRASGRLPPPAPNRLAGFTPAEAPLGGGFFDSQGGKRLKWRMLLVPALAQPLIQSQEAVLCFQASATVAPDSRPSLA